MEVLSSIYHLAVDERRIAGHILPRGEYDPDVISLQWLTFMKTKGLSLEEINGIFNDQVVVRLTDLTQEEKAALDDQVRHSNLLLHGQAIGAQSNMMHVRSGENNSEGLMQTKMDRA